MKQLRIPLLLLGIYFPPPSALVRHSLGEGCFVTDPELEEDRGRKELIPFIFGIKTRAFSTVKPEGPTKSGLSELSH